MSTRSFRVYMVREESGFCTGRLMTRGYQEPLVATGSDEQMVLDALECRLQDEERELEPFLWHEQVQTASIVVDVAPQVTVQKRTVIGKERILLEVHYAWVPIAPQTPAQQPPGYRVMLPRFGWWMVLQDLSMVKDVLRQAVSTALAGESARSLFEFREAARETVLEWRPRWRQRRRVRDSVGERFEVLRQVAENYTELARSGKLGMHFGSIGPAHHDSLLAGDTPPSLLLVGPSGVGKSHWVRQLARRLPTAGSAEQAATGRCLWATSAERIMAGMQYLGMWEQRCLDLVNELSGEGHWLYVGRLTSLVEHRTGASSIADLLQGAVVATKISIIAECSEAEYARLALVVPSLLGALQVVRFEPPPNQEVAALVAEYQERKHTGYLFSPEALRKLIRHLTLFRREQAFPGKLFAFLGWLDRQPGYRPQAPASLDTRDVERLYSRYSGLPERLISDTQVATMASLAEELERGVVGQASACYECARVLARLKAGLNDPDKPIGSLLFVGPTGVGKTELAKQLARFVFGSEQRLIRLDMSEYMLGSSTHRLLSDERGSRGLVPRVTEEPLSLILLDEIEKAHPAVFDLLLGVLGEGRLTASSGRLIDFRMALIVMTSNLGANNVAAGFGRAGDVGGDGLKAVREHFRPEFFNRIDMVVPFQPLSSEALRAIVDLELAQLTKREGLARRRLKLSVDAAAKQRLCELGWHPKYGARPLRRVIEEKVLTPIAISLARQPQLMDRTVRVSSNAGEIAVSLT